MTALATAQDVLRRLLDAVPVAWREDRVFRYAAIGAAVTMGLLLVRSNVPRQDMMLPPLTTAPLAGQSTVLSPAGQGSGPAAQGPTAVVPQIAPSLPLDNVTIVPGPDGDRFGTFKLERHP